MSKQYSYIERRIPATPRNKRLTDSIVAAASTGGGYIGGGGGTSYWQLVTTDADGNALAEEDQYLVPIGAYPVVSLSDVVAYATANPVANTPVTGYDTFGLVKIAKGCGLIVTDGVLSIDPSSAGGLNQEALASYLIQNKYVKEDDLATKGYLMLSSPLTGYVIADEYTAISPTDTLLTAIGKLERRFDGYVDLTTDQTIGGVKTFTETIYGGKDIVCYATDSVVANTPVASTTTFGLVKIGENLTVVDGVISAVAQQSGVQFEPGTALELTENSVLNVKLGTTLNTACAGNDSRLSDARKCPYSLRWSGYSSGSYDGSETKTISIPSNTNQLTNGAGYIKDGNGNFTTLSGSGDSSKYLAGNGQFYTIAASEISFPNGYVTLSTAQTISAIKTFSSGIKTGNTEGVYLQFSNGNGIVGYNAEKGVVSYIYLNYRSTLDYTRVTGSNDIETTGDIVAYAESSAVATTPVASTSVFGLVKIGSGISVSGGVISVSGGSSTASALASTVSASDCVITKNSRSSGAAIYLPGGNSIEGWRNGAYGPLYLNYYSTYDVCVHSTAISSDMRLKNIVRYASGSLDLLRSLTPIYYTLKADPIKQVRIGLSAQQVQALIPEAVRVADDGYLCLDYTAIHTLFAIGGLKELYSLHLRLANEVKSGAHWRLTKDEQIRQLQRECAELRARFDELEKGGAA
ncbi:MAG: tail fiber domain-containing protein [bacterium]|nr:tail fiber domain-containing protein [bacterium]